jgi:hypothetical protein
MNLLKSYLDYFDLVDQDYRMILIARDEYTVKSLLSERLRNF